LIYFYLIIFKLKFLPMTDPNLHLLTHPENWFHKGLLPVIRRRGNSVYNKTDVGIIMEDDLCCVWTGNYLGECDPLPFKSFEEWENMQKEEPTEILTALQKAISKELRRRKAEEKQTKLFEKWAAKHGYEFTKKPAKPEEKEPA